jgi:hypothetical protein
VFQYDNNLGIFRAFRKDIVFETAINKSNKGYSGFICRLLRCLGFCGNSGEGSFMELGIRSPNRRNHGFFGSVYCLP